MATKKQKAAKKAATKKATAQKAAQKPTPKTTTKPATPTPPKVEKAAQTPSSEPKTPQKTPEPAPKPKTTPDGRLLWALNGAGWDAGSIKAPGRIYQAITDAIGWRATYQGQKGGCPTAGQHYALASQAREACQKLEDSIE